MGRVKSGRGDIAAGVRLGKPGTEASLWAGAPSAMEAKASEWVE